MKAKKILKRIAKIESLMSKVTERSSASAPHIQELLREAITAIARAKKAVQSSSETVKDTPAKSDEQVAAKKSAPAVAKKNREEGGCEESHSGEGGEVPRPRGCEIPGEEGSREGGEGFPEGW